MFSNFSLNTNVQAYVKRTEKPTWGSILQRNESWGIYSTREATPSLVIGHALQKGSYTPIQTYCVCESAPWWAESGWCWWSKTSWGPTRDFPSWNLLKLQGRWWCRAVSGSRTLVSYKPGLESWLIFLFPTQATWGTSLSLLCLIHSLRERITWCNSWRRLEAKELPPPSRRLLWSQDPQCLWFPTLS